MTRVAHFYAEFGIDLPQRSGASNVDIKCFASPGAHKHGDRERSCSVSLEHGSFNCFGCGAKGGPYDAATILGRTPAEAMQLLERHGLVDNAEANGKPPEPPRLKTTEADLARYHELLLGEDDLLDRMLRGRAWTRAAVERLGVGVDPEAKRIVFPVRDRHGRLVGVLRYARHPGEPKLLAESGSRREMFPALETVASDELVFVVEGEGDSLTAASIGIAAVSIPGSQSWRSTWSSRFAGRRVVIVPDADLQGRELAQRVAGDLVGVAAEVRVLDLDPERDDGHDLSDWVLAGLGDDRSPEALEGARRLLLEMAEATPVIEPEEDDEVEAGTSVASDASVAWPAPLGPAAYQGVAGEFTRLVEPHTEADPSAVLVQFLGSTGNILGRNAHVMREAVHHAPNLFVGVVGRSSRGRKGSSFAPTRLVLRAVDDEWEQERVTGGLSSGEGLIFALRDAMGEDETAPDRRLLVIEEEFSSVLRVARREGNTLSPVVRRAWDGRRLTTMTRNAPLVASGAHVSVIGHITLEELRRELTELDIANGFANRFLWVVARRSKELPEGGQFHKVDIAPLVRTIAAAVEFASEADEIGLDDDARRLWYEIYPGLTADIPGLLGAVTARAEAQVTHLALIYALLDRSKAIRLEHLEAALEVWRYSFDSAAVIFGDRTGDPTADTIADALAHAADGLSRTEVRDLFGRHAKAERIEAALELLESAGRIERVEVETGGRPAERLRLRQKRQKRPKPPTPATPDCDQSDQSDQRSPGGETSVAYVASVAPSSSDETGPAQAAVETNGHVPIPGEPGFEGFVRNRFLAGFLTKQERDERVALHRKLRGAEKARAGES